MNQVHPKHIVIDTRTRELKVTWSNGSETAHDWEALRWACPCATCQGEMGQPGVLAFTENLTEEQADLADVRPVGRYALCLVWRDGHDSGIYPYAFLREIH